MNRWFSRWDRDVSRLVLTPGVALDLNLPPIWVMVLAPGGGGKTESSVELAKAYEPHVSTSSISEAGLLSMEKGTKGKGVLSRLGKRSLWAISDFGSIISLREETRAQIAAALREIYDGRWSRNMRGSEEVWEGNCGLVAACTNAIEKYHKLQKDLGDRYVQIRSVRVSALDLRERVYKQQGQKVEMRDQVREAGKQLLLAHNGLPKITDEQLENVAKLADFCAYARQSMGRDYKGQMYEVQEVESGGRLCQQFISIAQADACLLGQSVGQAQLNLLLRVATDSAPLGRARVLSQLCTPDFPELTWTHLFEHGGFDWKADLSRSLEELCISRMVEKHDESYRASERCMELIIPTLFGT